MLKKDVLRGQKAFDSVYKKGKSKADRYIVIFFKKNYLEYNRTAFVASKKVGNSVARNRAARLMKESYRHIKDSIDIGYDIIFIARNTIIDCKSYDVEKSMNSVVRRAGFPSLSVPRSYVFSI